jgi:hypothetical protein
VAVGREAAEPGGGEAAGLGGVGRGGGRLGVGGGARA